ncbi:MAG: PqqD family protein [Sulfurimonas sp.]|nr:PqqD family protein [Sulfurimonas sp.]MDQ7061004.1 PqqD family protein [Sulfurimonas sp.]
MQTIDQLVLDENNVAFHAMMGNSYQLNDIAKEMLVLLKHHKSKDEIVEELCKTYAIDENQLYIDVSDFISKLKVYGLML